MRLSRTGVMAVGPRSEQAGRPSASNRAPTAVWTLNSKDEERSAGGTLGRPADQIRAVALKQRIAGGWRYYVDLGSVLLSSRRRAGQADAASDRRAVVVSWDRG